MPSEHGNQLPNAGRRPRAKTLKKANTVNMPLTSKKQYALGNRKGSNHSNISSNDKRK